MHPAPSIIVFTVLSGAGLGMIAWLGAGLGPASGWPGWLAAFLAVALVAAGGIASVFHLGRPANARFAFSQWRSSWLSREACLMPLTLAVFTLHAGLALLAGTELRWLGLLAAALALATVHATSMIYAQLRTVPRWSATPTPALFIALALAGGLLGTQAVAGLAGGGSAGRSLLAILAAGGVWVWWQTAAAGARRGALGSDLATATGLARPASDRVRLLEPPHTGPNYLLEEMAFVVGRRRSHQLRLLGGLFAFVVPAALTLLAMPLGGWLLPPAFALHLVGVLALRWLFFAEAEHVQAFYYGYR